MCVCSICPYLLILHYNNYACNPSSMTPSIMWPRFNGDFPCVFCFPSVSSVNFGFPTDHAFLLEHIKQCMYVYTPFCLLNRDINLNPSKLTGGINQRNERKALKAKEIFLSRIFTCIPTISTSTSTQMYPYIFAKRKILWIIGFGWMNEYKVTFFTGTCIYPWNKARNEGV